MGAWSYEVLSNNRALDTLTGLANSRNVEKDIYFILHDADIYDVMSNGFDLNSLLLAAEIVDISLNGIDSTILGNPFKYKEWFRKIEKNPMESMRQDALCAVTYIQSVENFYSYWTDDIKEARKQMLRKIEYRLKGKSKRLEDEIEGARKKDVEAVYREFVRYKGSKKNFSHF